MGEIRVNLKQTIMVIVGTVERPTKTAFDNFILFLSTLHEVCSTMTKLLFLSIESGEFGDSEFHVKQK